MNSSLKDALRSVTQAAGLEVRKTSVYTSQKLRHRLLFSQLPIDLVLDVGANTGQFARQCRAAGYRGKIISFEPSAAAHASLLHSAASDPLWSVADRMALGATNSETEINIAVNSYSSSILPMLDAHLSAAPNSAYLQKEKVSLRRLDEVLAATAPGHNIFLKLDVQGYESQVLAGATHLLPHTIALQLEMSLLPLYEGETLMPRMCTSLTAKGFSLFDLEPSFRDSATGRLLQVDGIFTRPSAPQFAPSIPGRVQDAPSP
jgi:FkbM family methyltransferase